MTHKHTTVGNLKKDPIVYLHGWMSNGKSIVASKIFNPLLHDFCLFSPDFPGSGGLPFKPLGKSFQSYAEWLLNLIDQYFMGKKFHLIGNSMGGMIAQELALLAPKRIQSLILLVTSASPFRSEKPPPKKIWDAFLRYRSEKNLKKYLTSIIPYMVSAKNVERTTRVLTTVTPIVFPEIKALDERYEAMLTHDVRDKLHCIKIKTLVIGAEKDQLVPMSHSQCLAKGIPYSNLKILKNSGHMILIDAYHEAKKEINCFLESTGIPSAS